MNAAFAYVRSFPTFAQLEKLLSGHGRLDGTDGTLPWSFSFTDDSSRYVYIDEGGEDILADSTEAELAELERWNRGQVSIVVSYHQTTRADIVLRLICAEWETVIDDDLGHLVPGETFVSLAEMSQGPDSTEFERSLGVPGADDHL